LGNGLSAKNKKKVVPKIAELLEVLITANFWAGWGHWFNKKITRIISNYYKLQEKSG
jgi:hypothetical protein